jgi:hypothetical protein
MKRHPEHHTLELVGNHDPSVQVGLIRLKDHALSEPDRLRMSRSQSINIPSLPIPDNPNSVTDVEVEAGHGGTAGLSYVRTTLSRLCE